MLSSGGALSGVYFLFPQTVRKKLLAKKYQILTTDSWNHKHWETILNSYKEAKFNKRNLKFANFDGNGEVAQEIIKLQKKCKDLIEEYVSKNDKDNYRRAAKWCVVPVKAREILRKRGVKALDEALNSKWESKIILYGIEIDSRKKDDKLDQIFKESKGIPQSKISSWKNSCKEFGDTWNYQNRSHHARDIFESWCSAT